MSEWPLAKHVVSYPSASPSTSSYSDFPDNDDAKEVFVQASGFITKSMAEARHIVIGWVNGQHEGQQVWEILQLGKAGDTYYYQYPYLEQRARTNHKAWETWSLGGLSRDQREKIVELAEDIPYRKKSNNEGSRFWAARLLLEMMHEGLITHSLLARMQAEVPLPDVNAATTQA